MIYVEDTRVNINLGKCGVCMCVCVYLVSTKHANRRNYTHVSRKRMFLSTASNAQYLTSCTTSHVRDASNTAPADLFVSFGYMCLLCFGFLRK